MEAGNLPVTLTFRETHAYGEDPRGEIIVPIALTVGENAVELRPKLDTGAEFCIVQREYGEALGLNIEAGERLRIATATEPFVAYGHVVQVDCFGQQFDSVFYFAEAPNFPRNVLGRTGWLEQFQIAIIHYDRNLYLNPYNE